MRQEGESRKLISTSRVEEPKKYVAAVGAGRVSRQIRMI